MRLLAWFRSSFCKKRKPFAIHARFLALGLACLTALFLFGCESEQAITLSQGGSMRVASEHGVAIAQSQKRNAVVIRLLPTNAMQVAGELPTIFVAVYNGSDSEGFPFSTRDIDASFGSETVKVYTAKEIALKIRRDSSQSALNNVIYQSIDSDLDRRTNKMLHGDKGNTEEDYMQNELLLAKNEAATEAVDSKDPSDLVHKNAFGNDLGNEFGTSRHGPSSPSEDFTPDGIMSRMSQGVSSERINGNDLSQYLSPCTVAPGNFAGGVIKLNAKDIDIRRGRGPLKLVITVGSESHQFSFRYHGEISVPDFPANISEGDELSNVWKNMSTKLGDRESVPVALNVASVNGQKVVRGLWYMSEDDNGAMKSRKLASPTIGSPTTASLTTGPLVEMEPFFVTEETDRLPWRYATVPGYEILSHCGDPDSKAFLQQLDYAQGVLRAMIPKEFLAEFSVPHIIILSSPEVMSPLSKEILFSNSDSNNIRSNAKPQNTPNVVLYASDRTASLILLDFKSYDRTLVEPEYVQLLLAKRAPKLPGWLITGVMALYTDMFRAQVESGVEEESSDYPVPPFNWISTEKTKNIRGNKRAFCDNNQDSETMNNLFSREPLPASDEWSLWRARVALFVRWAFDGNRASRADALWKFAARAGSEPVTESMFEQCFGENYHDIVAQLNSYLPIAVEQPVELRIENVAAKWKPQFRNATVIETARIQGDWERLALCNVKREYEDSASNYIKTALTQKYEAGVRDPQLLAVLGLLDCYSQNDVSAKGFLDAAVLSKVVGPEVYFQLARIRYNEVRGVDLLNDTETNYVMEPLVAAYMQLPAQHEFYDLAIKVLTDSSFSPTNQQQNLLEAGLRFFPRDLDLLYNVAALDAAHATKDKALVLADRGLRLSATDEDRARFSSLKGRLTVGLK